MNQQEDRLEAAKAVLDRMLKDMAPYLPDVDVRPQLPSKPWMLAGVASNCERGAASSLQEAVIG